MKKNNCLIALAAAAMLLPASVAYAAQDAATDDPVVMTVNGKNVARSEFEYSYRKNNGPEVIDRKSVEEYVPLFVNYKLKVQAAYDAHLDTLTSYKQEFCKYRDMQVMPTLVNDADMEKQAKEIYETTKKNIGPDGLVHVRHILVRVGQNAEDSEQAKQKTLADSIYNAVKNGADFAKLASEKSGDPGSAKRGGDIGWIARGRTLKAFDEAVFKMKDGEVSQPVLTEVGYHIIRVEGHKQMEPYDSLRNDIYRFMDRNNVRASIAKTRLGDIATQNATTTEDVMNQRTDSLTAIDQNMKYLISEYHDGLLLYEVCNRQVWERVANDSLLLDKYFKKNKKKYAWEEPRFKGIAYYTRDAADVAAVKKTLKGKDFDQWATILRTTFNNDSILRIRAEKGIFKKGANGLVDKLEFKVADAKGKTLKDFPNEATYGKMLKAPEEMADVKALVTADCQEAEEKAWVETLKKKYPVTVNWDVVKTVENYNDKK